MEDLAAYLVPTHEMPVLAVTGIRCPDIVTLSQGEIALLETTFKSV